MIRKLRYQVDNFDEQQEHLEGSRGLSKKMAPDPNQHVQLCAPDANRTTISAYNVTLHREHDIADFLGSLSLFFKRSGLEPDVYSYKVCLDLGICLYMLTEQIIPYHSCRVTYDCQETGSKQTDLFCSTDNWWGEGPRYDYVLVQGQQRSSTFFAQVLSLFSASHCNQTHDLVILRPFTRKHRNKVTGYIELEEALEGQYEVGFTDSIIRAVHILPPTPTNSRFIVQDLVDGDAYLRFISMN